METTLSYPYPPPPYQQLQKPSYYPHKRTVRQDQQRSHPRQSTAPSHFSYSGLPHLAVPGNSFKRPLEETTRPRVASNPLTLPPLLQPAGAYAAPSQRRPRSSPHSLPSLARPGPSRRVISPNSRVSDLAKYAMTKDEKPVINADGSPLHRNNDHPLPALDLDLRDGMDDSSRKRKERDDDASLPGTPHSTASAYLMTPQSGAASSSPKRRPSVIDPLALEEDTLESIKPFDLAGGKKADPFPWYNNGQNDLANLSIPPQESITLFPATFNWNPAPGTQTNQSSNGGTPSGNATPVTGQANNSIPLDPTLSSIRSSAGTLGNGTGAPDVNVLPPELRFTDETLASATASPLQGDLDRGESSVSGMQGTDAGLEAGLLAPPGDGVKKEQPFSRSPELRVSHKLAERKRRKEMKELFDELRDELPSDRGMKASKWEILSKAIDHVRSLKANQDQMIREIDHLRREVDIARGGTGAYAHSYPTYNLNTTYPHAQSSFNAAAAAAVAGAGTAASGASQQVGQGQPQAQVPGQVQQPQQQQTQPLQQAGAQPAQGTQQVQPQVQVGNVAPGQGQQAQVTVE